MKDTTKLIHYGRNPLQQSGAVNPPIHQTSTIIFPTVEAYSAAEKGTPYYDTTRYGKTLDYSYGINGTPTTFALQEALCTLEGGDSCILTQSGLEAISFTLSALLSHGDHVLIADTVYGPTRRFCERELKRFGITVTYYAPDIGSAIADLIQDNTRLIFLESPGSITFEMQDVPAITAIAREKNILTALDNSWSTPLFYNPIAHGVDITIHAVTKYINGHSDVLMGAVISKDETLCRTLLRAAKDYGISVSPADCALVLRGLRTLAARMERHQANCNTVVEWITGRAEVSRLLYPPYPGHPGHNLWKRDWKGAASLFSIILDQHYDSAAIANMLNHYEYFGIGASWGGYESLVLALDPSVARTATRWQAEGNLIRFYIGLEDPEDLIRDMEAGFARLHE